MNQEYTLNVVILFHAGYSSSYIFEVEYSVLATIIFHQHRYDASCNDMSSSAASSVWR